MTKIQKVSQTITPFAGVSFINSEFNRCVLSQLIDKYTLHAAWFCDMSAESRKQEAVGR
ncbi:MAG: hypothetical protein LBG96_01990 [Tannerella sp.]|jgi:hypothetical protein|nr:hypothetical protein [Tannerella sp.]